MGSALLFFGWFGSQLELLGLLLKGFEVGGLCLDRRDRSKAAHLLRRARSFWSMAWKRFFISFMVTVEECWMACPIVVGGGSFSQARIMLVSLAVVSVVRQV